MSDLLSTIEAEYYTCCRKADNLLVDDGSLTDEIIQEVEQLIHEAYLCVFVCLSVGETNGN